MLNSAVALLLTIAAVAAAQPAKPLDEWKFDETKGQTANNSVANRPSGTLSVGASFVPGVAGNAVSLRQGESVTFPSSVGNFGTDNFTIQFWIRTTDANRLPEEVLGNRGAEPVCATPYVDFRLAPGGAMLMEVTGSSCMGSVSASSSILVNDGSWHFVAGVRSGASIALYVDNALQATAPAGDNMIANVVSPCPFVGGYNQDAMIYDYVFNGALDDLSIYSQALTFTLSTLGPGPCNGFYTGNFKGNVTVSPGQSCIFVNGNITGNVMQNGGNLGLNQSQVTGNVQVGGGGIFAIVHSSVTGNVQVNNGGAFTIGESQVGGDVQINGAGMFLIGPATKIGGNLQIQGLAATRELSQVCLTDVHNDLMLQNSNTLVVLGGIGSLPCGFFPGNTIGGNLHIQNNNVFPSYGFSTYAYGNTVGGNLQDNNNLGENVVLFNSVGRNLECNGNQNIIGYPNTAASKQGQCATF